MNYNLNVTSSAEKSKMDCICLSWSACLQMLLWGSQLREALTALPLSSGASSATMLIFILPAAFYLKLVKKEPLRSPQKVGVSKTCNVPSCKCLNHSEEVRKHMWSRKMKQARPPNKQTQELKVGNTAVVEGRGSDIHRVQYFREQMSKHLWRMLSWCISHGHAYHMHSDSQCQAGYNVTLLDILGFLLVWAMAAI